MASIVEFARSSLRRNEHWVNLRRMHREGWVYSIRKRYRLLQILNTKPISSEPLPPFGIRATEDLSRTPCEIHLLCSPRDYLAAIWALKSFYWSSSLMLPLVIHLDSPFSKRAIARLSHHFPNARIISRTMADDYVEPILKERRLLRLAKARTSMAFMLKLADFVLTSTADTIICFDSDVLFYLKPSELLGCLSPTFAGAYVQRDRSSVYNISPEEAAVLGWKLPSNVNSGIMAFQRRLIDLNLCEHFLSNDKLARATGWIEQTLYSLSFGNSGELHYLPPTYMIPPKDKMMDDEVIVARHYAGTTRKQLIYDGIPRFIKQFAEMSLFSR